MNWTLLLKILIITIFYTDSSNAYEFRADNRTFLKNVMREALTADAHPNQRIFRSNDVYTSEPRPAIINEPLEKEDLTVALRMRASEDNVDTKKRAKRFKNKKERDLYKERQKQDFVKAQTAIRARKLNRYRIDAVSKFMKNNLKATEYLYKEVERIRKNREVLDEPRKIIAEVEVSHNNTFKKEMDACFHYTMEKYSYDPWNKKPNTLSWHHVKTPDMEGVP